MQPFTIQITLDVIANTRFRRCELYDILLSTCEMAVPSPPRHSSIAVVLPVLANMAKMDPFPVSSFALLCVVVWLIMSQISWQWSSFASAALNGCVLFGFVSMGKGCLS